jgi:hypothetical protein
VESDYSKSEQVKQCLDLEHCPHWLHLEPRLSLLTWSRVRVVTRDLVWRVELLDELEIPLRVDPLLLLLGVQLVSGKNGEGTIPPGGK